MTSDRSPVWFIQGDGFPFVEPRTSREELVAYWFKGLVPLPGATIVVGTSTARRRVVDPATHRRVTRDWVTASALLYQAGGEQTELTLESYRTLKTEVSALGKIDELVIYCRLAVYQPTGVKLVQFGVRPKSQDANEQDAFAPRLYEEHGCTYYDDGRVTGRVETWVRDGKRGLTIVDFQSEHPGQGHAAAALEWIRSKYDIIIANGVGLVGDDPDFPGVGDIATMFWQHMRSKGLVNILIDDDGNEIPSEPPEAVSPRSA